MQRAQALALIRRAQKGDADARRAVALYVFERYKGRVKRLYNQDPAVSLEDMEHTFFEGIWEYTPKADRRGDPLYHIGQRGYWRVQSEVRSAHALMKQRTKALVGAHGWDERMWGEGDGIDQHPDPAEDFSEVLFRNDEARQRLQLIFDAPISLRAREAVERALAGQAGDPSEPGFNQRLAQAMGLSPQRISQLFNELREAAS